MSERPFKPKPGQVDFTNARYCPVVNSVVTNNGKILLVKRSQDMRLYPNYWNGISGFLDDKREIEDKVREELQEELGITTTKIVRIERGDVLIQEAPKYNRTWIVFPVHVEVSATDFKLNWEAAEGKWFTPSQARKLDLLPGFEQVLDTFF